MLKLNTCCWAGAHFQPLASSSYVCNLAGQHPSVIFRLGSGEDCLCPGPTPPLVNTPSGGGVLVFSAKKTHFLFSCPSVRAVSISQSPPSTRGKAGCLHSRSPCILHTQTTQRQSGQPEGQRRGSSCPDSLWKLHLNSSRQVLFLLSDLVYTSFGLGSIFFFETVEVSVCLHYSASWLHFNFSGNFFSSLPSVGILPVSVLFSLV